MIRTQEPNRTEQILLYQYAARRSEWSGVEWNGMIAAQFHSIFDQLISQEIKAFYSDQIQCFHSSSNINRLARFISHKLQQLQRKADTANS
jgi:hypothetical protein